MSPVCAIQVLLLHAFHFQNISYTAAEIPLYIVMGVIGESQQFLFLASYVFRNSHLLFQSVVES